MKLVLLCSLFVAALSTPEIVPLSNSNDPCSFVSRTNLVNQLKAVVAENANDHNSLGNNMWATIVDRDGTVCEVVFSGSDRFAQWRLSRVISAQKANTASSLCLSSFAFSTANLFQPAQPDGFLFGLQHSNPVDAHQAYDGNSADWGTSKDDMKGEKIGGVNVFGGGLCLYDSSGALKGGLGVSGDTSCGDHVVAWKLRHALNWDYVPAGVHALSGGKSDDNIIFATPASGGPSGFSHPVCPGLPANPSDAQTIANALPATRTHGNNNT